MAPAESRHFASMSGLIPLFAGSLPTFSWQFRGTCLHAHCSQKAQLRASTAPFTARLEAPSMSAASSRSLASGAARKRTCSTPAFRAKASPTPRGKRAASGVSRQSHAIIGDLRMSASRRSGIDRLRKINRSRRLAIQSGADDRSARSRWSSPPRIPDLHQRIGRRIGEALEPQIQMVRLRTRNLASFPRNCELLTPRSRCIGSGP